MDGHAVHFDRGENLGQTLAEEVTLLFAPSEFTPQDRRVFTASESRTVEMDHSLTRELGAYGALGVVVRRSAHRHLTKFRSTVQTHSERQRALVFKRKLAAGIFSRAIQPEGIAGHIDDGVVKESDGSRIESNVAAGTSAHQGKLRVDSCCAQQGNHQAGLVFAIAKTSGVGLRDRIRLVAVNTELERYIVRAAQDKFLDRRDFFLLRMLVLNQVIQFFPQGLVQCKLRTNQLGMPRAE